MKPVSLILATDTQGCIGKDNSLPWRYKQDMVFFRKMTGDCPVIMGRKTFESLPGPLTNRLMIVVSRSGNVKAPDTWAYAPIFIKPTLEEAINHAKLYCEMENRKQVFVIGGAEVYKQAITLADRVYWTEVQTVVHGDTFFKVMPTIATAWGSASFNLLNTDYTDGGMRLDFWQVDRVQKVTDSGAIRSIGGGALVSLQGSNEGFSPKMVESIYPHPHDDGKATILSVKLQSGDVMRSTMINESPEKVMEAVSIFLSKVTKE